MSSTRILIKGARVYDRAGDVHRPAVRDVLIAGDRIAAIAAPDTPSPEMQSVIEAASRHDPEVRILDGRDKLLIPGLVNAHYHSSDVLSKGRFEDMPFDVWALHAQPVYWGKRSKEEVRIRTLLGAMECLQNGITTVQDMNSLFPQDEETLDIILQAYDEVGIRVVFSIAARDMPQLDIAPFLSSDMSAAAKAIVGGSQGSAALELQFIESQIRRLSKPRRNFHWALSPSGPQRCSRELLTGIAELSARYDLAVLTHAYETRAQLARARNDYPAEGGSFVELLHQTGLLTPRTALAHGVYLTDAEIDRLAETGVGVVHNPLSNLKLKNGVAPLLQFKRAGIKLALGCDNSSCSDCQNLFQAMKFFTLLAAGSDSNPTGIMAADAIDAATVGGAAVLGLSGEIGEVTVGCKADVVLLDLTDAAYLPLNSAARQMVYSESGRGVHTTIVDGRIVVEGGRVTTVDLLQLREQLTHVMDKADRDFAALSSRQAPAVQSLIDANAKLSQIDLGLSRLAGGGGFREND